MNSVTVEQCELGNLTELTALCAQFIIDNVILLTYIFTLHYLLKDNCYLVLATFDQFLPILSFLCFHKCCCCAVDVISLDYIIINKIYKCIYLYVLPVLFVEKPSSHVVRFDNI